jgi:hypothetical protein
MSKQNCTLMGYLSPLRQVVAMICVFLLSTAGLAARPVGQDQPAAAPPAETSPKLPPEQLDSLVAPIALYPDPLLAQTLVACTYPLEIIQLQQWLAKNQGLKDQALADAVKKQDWDPSIQAMAGLPDVVKRLSESIKWTTDLGNAFLAQQDDVMDAVQRMRKKASDTGNLKPSEQQKVETKVVESKQVIVIEQANPQVVYVPSYNPTVVYGPPVYAYPPVYYPPPGYYAAGMAISFGVGVAMGAMWSGGWGYHSGWGGGNNNVVINNNNNFVNNSNRQNVSGGNRVNSGNTSWQHNPQHRGGAPYSDRSTANKYGGSARGDSASSRQASAQGRGGASASTMDRGSGSRGGASASTMDRGSGSRGGAGGASASTMDRGGSGGGDKVGNRSVSSSSGGGAFGGSSSSRGASASSQRGSSSYGGGGGRSSGGGGRSGGGGGRRR